MMVAILSGSDFPVFDCSEKQRVMTDVLGSLSYRRIK